MPRRRLLELLLGFVVFSTWLSPLQRELFVGDETKYSQVVREMRATHAFFLPTLGGVPFTHKPPLHFWAIDLLTFLFGTYSLWAFVLPSLVAFVLQLWLVVRMGDELFGDRDASLAAALLCGTTAFLWGSAQTARMDVTFTALLTAGAWMMFRFFERNDFRALTAAGAAIGVAALVKGPMAPVMGLALFALHAWRRRPLPRGNYALPVAAMLVIPLLWVVPAFVIGGAAYRHEVLMKQTVGRAVGAWVHKGPPWYYLAHMPGIVFPWFFLAVCAVVAAFRLRDPARPARLFLVDWILAVLLPYSVISSKLDVYMMALFPAVALLAGEFATAEEDRGESRWAVRLNVATLILLALVGVAGFFAPRFVRGPEAALASIVPLRVLFSLLVVLSLGSLTVAAVRRSLFFSTAAIALALLPVLAYAAVALMPLANQVGSTRPLVAALEAQQVIPDRMALYACPNLWTRSMPRALEEVHYVSAADLAHGPAPELIATSRAHSPEIAASLAGYRRVAEVRMIGKWFDVYRK